MSNVIESVLKFFWIWKKIKLGFFYRSSAVVQWDYFMAILMDSIHGLPYFLLRQLQQWHHRVTGPLAVSVYLVYFRISRVCTKHTTCNPPHTLDSQTPTFTYRSGSLCMSSGFFYAPAYVILWFVCPLKTSGKTNVTSVSATTINWLKIPVHSFGFLWGHSPNNFVTFFTFMLGISEFTLGHWGLYVWVLCEV